MEICSVFDPAFASYGQVVTGRDAMVKEIVETLKTTPLADGTAYVPEDPALAALAAAEEMSTALYGGMPIQMGWCNGFNTKLNCLEYHRDSEFNVSPEDFILLVARRDEIEDGILDTRKVKAFQVPAGTMVECFATTLHYAPCHADPAKGFHVLIALPKGTNTERPVNRETTFEDRLLWARNKWLLAHADSAEAKAGAYVGLVGENIDIKEWII